jgi:hypothetical protein
MLTTVLSSSSGTLIYFQNIYHTQSLTLWEPNGQPVAISKPALHDHAVILTARVLTKPFSAQHLFQDARRIRHWNLKYLMFMDAAV